ncbi:MAG: hypothetical protein EOP56_05780 [Sphingobacteriales bacterium]|nr:MAG: hypothetical protein EOP56_05780 [Sphingobacteriales bacterium]
MRIVLLLIVLLWASVATAHPLKMSYTAVKWEQGQKYISVEFRVFMDDIAVALQEEQNVKIDPFNKASVGSSLAAMSRYFVRHFNLKLDGVLLPAGKLQSFKMSEFNGTTFLYRIPVTVTNAKRLAVFNNILTTQYKEQQDMCQVRRGENKYSQKFTSAHTSEIVEL